MLPYQPRIIEQKLAEYQQVFSVIALTGPRQSGKSTLLLGSVDNSFCSLNLRKMRTAVLKAR